MTTEYFRWTEYAWKDPDKDWRKAETLVSGIDVGSVSSQAVILADGELYCYCNTRTGSNSPESALNALNMALEGTGIKEEDLQYTVGTGYGRVNIPMSNKAI
ncbi:MAG: benzoyl-CoA reductase, bzd-type, subunit Q, partial [Dehalococcoidia bacterium]|nr:benzoyl-CoA reductase, bzd-type, subunit Q [Dehalococcoidia bacterium]